MIQLPDDPIIACALRTGYPPWMQGEWEEDEEENEDLEQAKKLLDNLELYGYPLFCPLYELPPKGGTTIGV